MEVGELAPPPFVVSARATSAGCRCSSGVGRVRGTCGRVQVIRSPTLSPCSRIEAPRARATGRTVCQARHSRLGWSLRSFSPPRAEPHFLSSLLRCAAGAVDVQTRTRTLFVATRGRRVAGVCGRLLVGELAAGALDELDRSPRSSHTHPRRQERSCLPWSKKQSASSSPMPSSAPEHCSAMAWQRLVGDGGPQGRRPRSLVGGFRREHWRATAAGRTRFRAP